jgi:hypothetical protein
MLAQGKVDLRAPSDPSAASRVGTKRRVGSVRLTSWIGAISGEMRNCSKSAALPDPAIFGSAIGQGSCTRESDIMRQDIG